MELALLQASHPVIDIEFLCLWMHLAIFFQQSIALDEHPPNVLVKCYPLNTLGNQNLYRHLYQYLLANDPTNVLLLAENQLQEMDQHNEDIYVSKDQQCLLRVKKGF